MSEEGEGATDPRVGQAYAKLFWQQQAFAAKQAQLFAKIAEGDAATIESVLALPHDGPLLLTGAENGGGEGGLKRKRKYKKRDPDAPK